MVVLLEGSPISTEELWSFVRVTIGIQAKEFNLGFIRPENLVSHGLSLSVAFWQTPSGLSCAFY